MGAAAQKSSPHLENTPSVKASTDGKALTYVKGAPIFTRHGTCVGQCGMDGSKFPLAHPAAKRPRVDSVHSGFFLWGRTVRSASLIAAELESNALEIPRKTWRRMPLERAWVELLARCAWNWFGTFTFASSVHPEAADKAFRWWVRELNRHVYGKNWKRGGGIEWVRGLEYQKRSVIHYHALLRTEANLNYQASRLEWMRQWELIGGGFARIYGADCREELLAYIAKYVAKGGEIDLSQCLEAFPVHQGQLQ